MQTDHIHTEFSEIQSFQFSENEIEKIETTTHLRPTKFSDYPGQDRIVENLKIYTKSAKLRNKILDHCLFHGPPGLGKTTLAGIVAHEMGCHFKSTSGPIIEKAADLVGILANIEPNTILFIDEIHRIPVNLEEILYSAMEDNKLDILVGQGQSARTVKLDLPPFCLIGATTKPGSLSAPLRDRFGIQEHLEYYNIDALQKIILRSSEIFEYPISVPAANSLSKRCRGTPRVANQLLKRMIDFAVVHEKKIIDEDIVTLTLNQLGIDIHGLTIKDREILNIIQERYNGGPVGLDAIASSLNEERSTLEDVYEPFLVFSGFLLRTPRGRMLPLKK